MAGMEIMKAKAIDSIDETWDYAFQQCHAEPPFGLNTSKPATTKSRTQQNRPVVYVVFYFLHAGSLNGLL